MSQYLVEIEWQDPIAANVRRLLEALPSTLEQTTRQLPLTLNSGFVVVNATDRAQLNEFAQAAKAAGADVRIIAGAA